MKRSDGQIAMVKEIGLFSTDLKKEIIIKRKEDYFEISSDHKLICEELTENQIKINFKEELY